MASHAPQGRDFRTAERVANYPGLCLGFGERALTEHALAGAEQGPTTAATALCWKFAVGMVRPLGWRFWDEGC